jgi:hypothetical protein
METLLLDIIEPRITAVVKDVVKRMGGTMERAKKSGDLFGYVITINGGKASFYTGTEYSLDISYGDPDFFDKLAVELEERLRKAMKRKTWARYLTHLSSVIRPFISKSP